MVDTFTQTTHCACVRLVQKGVDYTGVFSHWMLVVCSRSKTLNLITLRMSVIQTQVDERWVVHFLLVSWIVWLFSRWHQIAVDPELHFHFNLCVASRDRLRLELELVWVGVAVQVLRWFEFRLEVRDQVNIESRVRFQVTVGPYFRFWSED